MLLHKEASFPIIWRLLYDLCDYHCHQDHYVQINHHDYDHSDLVGHCNYDDQDYYVDYDMIIV